MVQIKKVVQCGPAVGRFAALQQQRNPLAGPPSLSDCLERAEPVQPSRLAVKGGTWHYFQLSCQPAKGEAHLTALRQSRAEARAIRMRELERKQREQDLNADRAFDLRQLAGSLDGATAAGADAVSGSTGGGSVGPRRGNPTAPTAATGTPSALIAPRIERAVTQLTASAKLLASSSNHSSASTGPDLLQSMTTDLQEVRDCFQAIMVELAQLDNERSTYSYQNELLKDEKTDLEESCNQAQREYQEMSKERNALKRDNDRLAEELRLATGQLLERDALIEQHGLVIVNVENETGTDAHRALVSNQNALLLETVSGSLDARLSQFEKEKTELRAHLEEVQSELQELKRKAAQALECAAESQDARLKQVSKRSREYRLQDQLQDNGNPQTNLYGSESLLIRYRSSTEAEPDLKLERKALLREKCEAEVRVEELESVNQLLLDRLQQLRVSIGEILADRSPPIASPDCTGG
ncbi:leucine-rich repeat flightless-interacting protein 2-like isoform X2 [Anopheles albimanus]|uniref:leucine-rich repeat flightless-interacting protein 2-like isoform X2 n=1 Tax=Anopheles albimanus TaxID=7167 RepID=UPI00164119F3|nr:leucine-rich repeat flightless-interacting protein 2-like isoform X2 [Anopheles albimanus]